MSILDSMRTAKERRSTPMSDENEKKVAEDARYVEDGLEDGTSGHLQEQEGEKERPKKQIFQNLCFYINGSTAPLISDHKLKYLLAEHGATMSIGLGRRTVTHVIVGISRAKGGAGRGLAAGKIQKEISRVGGKGVKYVSVEWILESIKARRRVSKAPYTNTSLVAPSGQRSVLGMLKSSKPGQAIDKKEVG